MLISHKDYNRCTQETFLKGPDLDVNMFSDPRNIPSVTIDINLRSCVLNRHKLRQSQIATLLSQFVICRNLWSKPWRHKLSPITLKTWSRYLGEYPGLLFTLIWKVVKLIIVVLRKPSWKRPILMWICFVNLGVYPRLLLISIWEVVFWTVTKCDSHKLRQFRNPCRRILSFVAFCDHGRDGTNWVQ